MKFTDEQIKAIVEMWEKRVTYRESAGSGPGCRAFIESVADYIEKLHPIHVHGECVECRYMQIEADFAEVSHDEALEFQAYPGGTRSNLLHFVDVRKAAALKALNPPPPPSKEERVVELLCRATAGSTDLCLLSIAAEIDALYKEAKP
jgi:hypothetical protein